MLARIMHETPLPKPGAGGRDGLPPKAFGTGAQSASGASTFLG